MNKKITMLLTTIVLGALIAPGANALSLKLKKEQADRKSVV